MPDTTWSFTTNASSAAAPQTMFGDAVPVLAPVDDSAPVELGTAFSPTRDGVVQALRFHKGTGNGGTHVGSLWTSTGTRLAQVTFTGETPNGWQRAALSTPVRLTAGQTYVVSYLAPQGHYSATADFFALRLHVRAADGTRQRTTGATCTALRAVSRRTAGRRRTTSPTSSSFRTPPRSR